MVRLGRSLAGAGGLAHRTHFNEAQLEKLERRYHAMAGPSGHLTLEELCSQPETLFVPLFGMYVEQLLITKATYATAVSAARPKPSHPVEQQQEPASGGGALKVDLTTLIEALSVFSPSAPTTEKLKVLMALLPMDSSGLVAPDDLFAFYHGVMGGCVEAAVLQHMCDQVAQSYGGDVNGYVPRDKLVHGIMHLPKLTVLM